MSLDNLPKFETEYFIDSYVRDGTEYTTVSANVSVNGKPGRVFVANQGINDKELAAMARPFLHRLEMQKFLYYQVTQKVAQYQREVLININNI